MSKKGFATGLLLAAGLLASSIASAAVVVLNFDTLNPQGEYVGNYYNGGCGTAYNGGSVTCGGPADGIEWDNAVAGGALTGLWNTTANPPSSNNVIGIPAADPNDLSVLTVTNGFTGGFSFWYSAPFLAGSVTVEDINGDTLASFTLQPTGMACPNFVQGAFASCWLSQGVGFAGTAYKVVFQGTPNQLLLDNVTFGSSTAYVPEPAVLGMFGLGLLLIGGFVALRRRQSLKA